MKEIITIRKDVAPGTIVKLTERIKDYGLIEELRVRFYPGVERALQVEPYVMKHAGKKDYFFTTVEGTEPYITGDDDYFIFPVSLPVAYDDMLTVKAENKDTAYTYTLVVDIVISYIGEVL